MWVLGRVASDPMARYRIQFTLPSTTLLPRDDVVNTFHVQADDVAMANLCGQAIWDEFYSVVGEYVGPQISRSVDVNVRIYDLADAEPRTPVSDGSAGILAASSDGTALPAEVAVCLSLEALQASGANPQRRRGRLFFGPLNGDALAASGSYGRPSASLRGSMTTAAEAAGNAIIALGGFWCIYSRADDAFRAVIRGWVDDEFDTQRRRGRDASSRLLFTLSPP